jgi:4-oxalocrotonate tautomerase
MRHTLQSNSSFKFKIKINPKEEMTMPLIQVKLIENVFTPQQKNQIITKLTDAMVSIEGENMRPVTWVVIEEARSGEWGIGGQPMTTEAVLALAAGKKPAA